MTKIMQKICWLAFCIAICLSAAARASSDTPIMISDLVVRATTSSAGASAAYVTIHNHADEADRLIGASIGIAKKVEIHEMTLDGDVMKMREIKGGLLIPAKGEARLAKGGNHLMLIGLTAPIIMGQSYDISFEFEKAGIITKTAHTISLSGKAAKSQHQKSDGHKNHGHKGHKH